MKKLIVIMLLACVALVSNAQDKRGTMSLAGSFLDFALTGQDTVSNFDTLWYAQIRVSKDYDQDYNALISLDHVSGTPSMTVKLYGKVFAEDAWAELKSFDHVVANDTIIRFSETTNQRYRLYKVEAEENGTAKTLMEDLKFKVWQ